MMAVLRPLTAILLALFLSLTGQGIAIARGATGPTGQMVICTGTGPVMVYIDAEGEPTHAPQLCPEKALALLVAAELPPPAILSPGTMSRVVWERSPVTEPRIRLLRPSARGPPGII